MKRKKSIMRSQVVPLLFEECRIVFPRLPYVSPAILGVKDLRFPARSVEHLFFDLPLSNCEFVVSFPEAARDLGIRIDSNKTFNNKKFVM